MDDFDANNQKLWNETIRNTFGAHPPDAQSWNKVEDMVRVLSPFCRPNLNHGFFPFGGGHDIDSAHIANEEGCLELRNGEVGYVFKPARLHFEYIEDLPSLSYFRLDTHNLAPVDGDVRTIAQREEVVELSPGDYTSRENWDRGFMDYDENGDEVAFPPAARIVVRYLRGSFSMFAKGSIYNHVPEYYDGRHGEWEHSKFRDFLRQMATTWLDL